MLRLASVLSVCLALSMSLAAQSTTWRADAASTVWSDPANWTAGVPDAMTNAVIVSGLNDPVATAGAVCNSLIIDDPFAVLDVPAGVTLTVGGNASSIDGRVTGAGVLLFVGTGRTISTATGGSLSNVTIDTTAGSFTFSVVAISGNLLQNGGAIVTSGSTATTVGGNATFAGGTLDTPTRIAVAGDVAFQGTLATAWGTLTVGGSWASDANFRPNSGSVVFVGAGPRTFVQTGSRFAGLWIDAGGRLDISGGDTVRVNGALTVDGVLDIPQTSIVRVGGSGTVNASTGSITGDGTIAFFGTGTIVSSSRRFPHLEIEAGAATYTLRSAVVSGNFVQNGGTITWSSSGDVVTVEGDATFAGGTFGWGGSRFTVEGDVTFQGTLASRLPSTFEVRGDLTSDANFQPSTGRLSFIGAVPRTLVQNGSAFPDVLVPQGGRLDVSAGDTVLINGSLTVAGTIDLPPTSRLRVGGSADLQDSGDVTGDGTVSFFGNGAICSDFGALPNTEFEATATTYFVDFLTVRGDLAQLGGTITRRTSGFDDLIIRGNATFAGGSLNLSYFNVTVDGDASFRGTLASAAVTGINDFSIMVGGNWDSDINFQQGAGVLRLTGTRRGTFAAPGSRIANLTVNGGRRVDIPPGNTVVVDRDLFVAGVIGLPLTSRIRIGRNSDIGTGGAVTGDGLVSFFGTGRVINNDALPQATYPNVEFEAGAGPYRIPSVMIRGDFVQNGGTITTWTGTSEVVVGGNATFSAGTFDWRGESFTVDGDVSFQGTQAIGIQSGVANRYFSVAGSWSSDANFRPTVGNLRFTGLGPRTFAQTASEFAGLSVASGGRLDIPAGTTVVIDGDLLVDGTLGLPQTSTIRVGGSGTLNATGDFVGDGTVSFFGTGAIQSTSPRAYPRVEIEAGAGEYAFRSSTVRGEFVQSGGTIKAGNGNDLVTIRGDGTFNGGTFSWFGSVFQIDSDVRFQGTAVTQVTGTGPSNPYFGVGGNWTSDANFRPTFGEVRFVKGGASTVSAAASVFPDLRVSAATTLVAQTDVTTSGLTTVEGTIQLGSRNLRLGGNATFVAGGQVTSSPSTGICVIGLSVISGPSSAPPLLQNVTLKASATLRNVVIVGTLEQQNINNSEELTIEGTVRVDGNATFRGCDVTGPGTLDLNGPLTTFATSWVVDTPPAVICCSGDWVSDANFNPTSGVVKFDGTAMQNITANSLTFNSLDIEPASNLNFNTPNLTVSARLRVLGEFTAPAQSLDAGDLVVEPGGELDLGGGAYTVAGDFTQNGSVTGTGTVVLNGNGTVSGTNPLGNLEVSTAGTVSIAANTATQGAFTVTGGSVVVEGPFRVEGPTRLGGGTLSGPGTLIAEGGIDVTGTTATVSLTSIECSGTYLGDGSLTPLAGIVKFVGAAQLRTTLPGQTLRFFGIQVLPSSPPSPLQRTTVGNDLDIRHETFLVAQSATFDVNVFSVGIVGPPAIGAMTVNGNVEVRNGARLRPRRTRIDVSNLGSICVLGGGASNQSAVVGDAATGGLDISIAGTIGGHDFEFRDIGRFGVRLLAGARIAPPPMDLRNGRFVNGSMLNNATMLSVALGTDLTFQQIEFHQEVSPPPAGSPPFNVTAEPGSGRITFVGGSGANSNRWGAAYENDPDEFSAPPGRIRWIPGSLTTLDSAGLVVRGGLERVEIEWTTTAELSSSMFFLTRSDGGFGRTVTPVGNAVAGATYRFTDVTATYPGTYTYKLEEDSLLAGRRTLAIGSARPWPGIGNAPNLNGRAWLVGPGGYADIGAAIAATPPNAPLPPTIFVAPGTYPSFTITRPVRIVGDGSGPVVIDTSSAPIRVQNIPGIAGDTTLYSIDITGPTAMHGIEIASTQAIVVLDDVRIDTPMGVPAILADAATRVVVQSCDCQGFPGIQLRNGSTALISRTETSDLWVQSGSTATGIQLQSTLAPTVEPTATLTQLAGAMPRVDAPVAWIAGKSNSFTVEAEPNAATTVFLSFRRPKVWLDLSVFLPFVDTPLLIDAAQLVPIAQLPLTSGSQEASLTIPDNVTDYGQDFPFQPLSLIPSTGTVRFGAVRDLVIMP